MDKLLIEKYTRFSTIRYLYTNKRTKFTYSYHVFPNLKAITVLICFPAIETGVI